jgi:hypothetical protein
MYCACVKYDPRTYNSLGSYKQRIKMRHFFFKVEEQLKYYTYFLQLRR